MPLRIATGAQAANIASPMRHPDAQPKILRFNNNYFFDLDPLLV